MTYRSLSGIIVGIIILIELCIFLILPTPTKLHVDNRPKDSGSLFSRTTTDVDMVAANNLNTKFLFIVGSTIAIGGIVTFSLPNKKIKKGA